MGILFLIIHFGCSFSLQTTFVLNRRDELSPPKPGEDIFKRWVPEKKKIYDVLRVTHDPTHDKDKKVEMPPIELILIKDAPGKFV